MNITNNDTKKTKKNRNNKIDKAKMWNTFDEEFKRCDQKFGLSSVC